MNVPKNTKFTLKNIVENLGNIPENNFGEQKPPMAPEAKKRLKEMATMFESYGSFLAQEARLMESAKSISELCKLAHEYALQESGDYIQSNIVERDMKDLNRRVAEYSKLCQECYGKMQQLGVTYHDIRHVLGRYYKLSADVPEQDYKEVES